MKYMKKILLPLLCLVSTTAFSATTTFKVTQNNPNHYGEESIQIKTTKGNLAIYSINLSESKQKTLMALKKGDCVAISTPYKLEKSDSYYAIDEINSVKKVTCPK